MKNAVVTLTAVATAAVVLAAPVAADDMGYLSTLDSAGLMSHDGSTCNMIDGICHGQFETVAGALGSGRWVCDQAAAGRSTDMIIDWLSHGEGLMPSSYNAEVITRAAIANLC